MGAAQTDFDKWVDEDEQDGAEDPTSGMEGMGGSESGSHFCVSGP